MLTRNQKIKIYQTSVKDMPPTYQTIILLIVKQFNKLGAGPKEAWGMMYDIADQAYELNKDHYEAMQ